jgi:hypothetical protein
MNYRYLSGTYYDISVTHEPSGFKYFYQKVPFEHVKMLEADPDLRVKTLKYYKGKQQVYKEGETYER